MDVPGPHRFEYTAELDRVRATLGGLAGEASQIVIAATAAVAGPDAGQADTIAVHAALARLHADSQELDDELVVLLACQNPVAGDLQLVVACLRIATAVERMGELADHIATTADLRRPASVVPAPLRPVITRLGRLCGDLAEQLAAAIRNDDREAARQVEAADDQIDQIHRRLLATLTDPAWPHGVQSAVDLTLLSRYYERFGDQAVTAARRLARVHPATT
ncbi:MULTISPECIES: PhoU domain-containing protein [unclassified Frankia]|uniref:phosphate signaling complex PhoU family protein n=1 Tax=unclassified Frankia TaxID=2632575 RepID=UPI001EF40C2C|nr:MULTISPECIES: PhoU domain-containing protein [unclassified Frankia]